MSIKVSILAGNIAIYIASLHSIRAVFVFVAESVRAVIVYLLNVLKNSYRLIRCSLV